PALDRIRPIQRVRTMGIGGERNMAGASWTRLAGWAGIGAAVLFVLGSLAFLAAGIPPDPVDGARFAVYAHKGSSMLVLLGLLFSLGFMFALVFALGVRDVLRSAGG